MPKNTCPCGSNKSYNSCCQQFHLGKTCPTTVDLLRARFCAFIRRETNFLVNTHHPFYVTPQLISDLEDICFVPSNLKIVEVKEGQIGDSQGSITYSFNFTSGSKKESYTTTSLYSKMGDQWFYEKDV